MSCSYKNESGRSMVEMLGVLAVIGVLSVAGIAGYNSAMNKHQANELLNEASKRAAIVAMQITSGKTTPSIAEFNNTLSSGTFGTPTYTAGATTFALPLTAVDEDVCTQMKASTGTNSVMAITGECGSDLTLTFNANMSPGVTLWSSYDENAGAKACTTDSDCDTGCQQCSGTKCISKCAVGEYCAKGTSDSDYACKAVTPISCETSSTCPDSAPCCANNVCTIPTCPDGTYWLLYRYGWECYSSRGSGTCSNEIKSCTSNADCDTPDEYCYIDSNSDTCSTLDMGRCSSVGTVNTVAKAEGASGSAYNGYVYSSEKMSWWAADNWCKAQGMRLVSLRDLGITLGYISNADWNALKAAFGSDLFWTVDSSTSCNAFILPSGDINIYQGSRSADNYALCK